MENACRILNVSASGYYAWLQSKPSGREIGRMLGSLRRSRASMTQAKVSTACAGFIASCSRTARVARATG